MRAISQKLWIIWSNFLYFNFTSFKDTTSSPFVRFQFILHDSRVLFSKSWNFYKLTRVNLISGGETILQKVWFIWSPLLYLDFKSFMDTISLAFIRFQFILQRFRSTFLIILKFLQIKEGGSNFSGKQFCRMSKLFGPPFCISILKVL